MKQSSRLLPVFISILIALVIHTGCRENTIINSKVSPATNSVGVFDTNLSCITHTYFYDSIQTNANFGGIPIFQGVGTYTDPFFGSMTAATYFNVIPQDYTPLDTTLIDSAVLILPYSGFAYGDTVTQTLTQSYQVFYLLDTVGIGSIYYAYSTKPLDYAHPLSAPTTVNVYNIKDSFGVNTVPQNHSGLRIKLNLPNLMSRLIPAVNLLATSSNPTQDFLNAFNGICVTPSNIHQLNTVIPYFQLDGADPYSEAGIIIYSHYVGTNILDTTSGNPVYYFNSGYCAHFNNVVKSYSHSPSNNLFHSTQPNDQIIALQNQPGANIDVVIPGIKSLPAGIINKAELQLTLLPGYGNNIQTTVSGDSILFTPELLSPTGVGNSTYPTGVGAGMPYYIADLYPVYSSSPLTVLDGSLHYLVRGGVTVPVYTVDIPREVMASISAQNDTLHLHLNGSLDYYGAFHMVAGGGGYPDTIYRPRLFVVYSKLNN